MQSGPSWERTVRSVVFPLFQRDRPLQEVGEAGDFDPTPDHLGQAQAVNFRGEELTVNVLLPALRLPSRIP